MKRAAVLKVVGASVVRNVGNRRERSEIAVEAGTAGGGTSHARERRRRIDAREHERASVFVCMRIVGQPASLELLGRLPDEFAGQRVGVGVAEIRAVGTSDVAVLLAATGSEASLQSVGQRRIQRQKAIEQLVGPEPATDCSAELVPRISRRHQYRATDRVTTKQRALRPAQHLHVVDVAQVHPGSDGGADVDIIDIQADARIYGRSRIGLADAADEDLGRCVVSGERRVGSELQIGNDLRELVRLKYLALLECIAAHSRNGDRRLLQVLPDLACSDGDLLQYSRLPFCFLGHGFRANQGKKPAQHEAAARQ